MTMRRISVASFMENPSMSKYYKRSWLNKKEGTAFIECLYEPSFGSHHECSVKIGDCYKTSNIDFVFYDKKTKAEKVAKLSSIIDELIALKVVLEEAEVKK